MKELISTLLILLSGPAIVLAQFSVTFQIVDSSGLEVDGAWVELSGPVENRDLTNSKGRTTFSLPGGQYDVSVEHLGFQYSATTVRVSSDEIIEIPMKHQTLDLPGVEVQAKSISERKDFVARNGATSYFLSKKDLGQIRSIDVHEGISRIPGVQIQQEDGFGLRPNIGIRGSGVSRSSKVLIMEDGIPTAPAPYTAPAAYYFPTFGRMDGLEVRMGSASLESGPYTTGGAINLLSTAIPDHQMVRLNAGLGSFESSQVNIKAGDQIGRFGYLVEYFDQSSGGFKNLDGVNDNTGFNKRDIHLKARYLLAESGGHRHLLSAKFVNSMERSFETYLGLTYDDFQRDPRRRYAASERDEMNTGFSGGNLTHTWTFPGQSALVTTVYGHRFARNWYKLDKVDAGNGKVGISNILSSPDSFSEELSLLRGQSSGGNLSLKNNNREYYTFGIQSRFEHHWNNQRLRLGLRLHGDGIDRFQWVDTYSMEDRSLALTSEGEPGTESNRVENSRVGALYGEYTIQWNRWRFQAGMRGEYIESGRSDYGKSDPNRTGSELEERTNEVYALLPGLTVQYQLDHRSQLFGSVVRGFSPPGNHPETQPEESINSELGFRYFKNRQLQIQLTGFWHEYDNLLGSNLVAGGAPAMTDLINGGNARSMGLEAYLRYAPSPKWPLELSYAYTSARFTEDFESDFGPWGEVSSGDYLPYVAPHTAWAQWGYSGNRFSIVAQMRYQSTSLAETAANIGAADPLAQLDARWLLSMQARYTLPGGFVLYGRATNLLDQVFPVAVRPAGWRPGLPRYIELGFEYQLSRSKN